MTSVKKSEQMPKCDQSGLGEISQCECEFQRQQVLTRSKIIHKKAKKATKALKDIGFNALNTLSLDDNVKKSKENVADADSDAAIGAAFNIHKDSEKLFWVFCGHLIINDDELGFGYFDQKTKTAH
ncbi:hypothetical protein E4U35_001564 [Claviceps purpurea]|nr:hypothetical protein E4U35_001564 [Claviceps purpurea]